MSNAPRPPYRLKPEEIDEAARLLKAIRELIERQGRVLANSNAIQRKISINLPPSVKGHMTTANSQMLAARKALIYATTMLESALDAVGWHDLIWPDDGEQP